MVTSAGTTDFAAAISIPNNAASGSYNIKIATQDTTGAPSHSFTASLVVDQDFIVSSSTPSQTVTAGQTSGAYNLTVQPVGSAFDAPVTLSCPSGLPAGAQCLFNPSTPVTPGTSAVNVVMNISTKAARANLQADSSRRLLLYALWMLLPGIVIASAGMRQESGERKVRLTASIVALLLMVLFLPGCSGVSGGGGGTPPPVDQPKTYQITVTGTSPGTPPDSGQSVLVTLVVN